MLIKSTDLDKAKSQITDIAFFHIHHARVDPQLVIQLSVTDIDSVNLACAVLQHINP